MASIDIHIGNQKFSIRGDADNEHLHTVADMVQEKMQELMAEHPTMSATKVALLAAMEFASESVKGRRQLEDYRATLLEKTGHILDRIERELTPPTN
ncbi:cell division protein ZapA [bacterium]|nr:cell division protein ZapA [bacterium]